MMRGKTEEEKYNVFPFLIGEQGRDIFIKEESSGGKKKILLEKSAW